MNFDIDRLIQSIQQISKNVGFAYLLGSSQNGIVDSGSDIDIAIYLKNPKDRFNTITQIISIIETNVPNTPIDVVVLNDTNTLLAFEAIKGKMLFVMQGYEDVHAAFYSQTARQYEYEIAWMQKQLKYRNYEVQWNN